VNVALASAVAVVATTATLLAGAYVAAVMELMLAPSLTRHQRSWRGAFLHPLSRAAVLAHQSRVETERPDWQAWALAPGLLLALAASMLVVVPLAPGLVIAGVPHGVVLFGATAALVVIPTFLEGWSPNSVMALLGGYRMFAQALSYMIPLALVLIGTALPAESLDFGRIVADQQGLWNVVRMPLGLPVYLAAVTGLAFWGPLSLPAGADIGGGIDVEASSLHLLLWRIGQRGVLVGAAAAGTTAFLGGWQGPLLPGPAWVVVKTLVLLALLVASRHWLARIRPERFVVLAWTLLLPLALLDIFLTGGWLLL
jgi:NADH-quinone oxidoreductase subunit H